MKKSKKILIFLFFAFTFTLFIDSCASSKFTGELSEKEASTKIRLSPDVEEEMLQPSYWISRAKNPYQIKMTKSQIARWNQNTCNICYPDSNAYIIEDLRTKDSLASAEEIREGMQRYTTWFKWYKTKEGEIKTLTNKEWQKIYNKMNFAPLGSFQFFCGTTTEAPADEKDYPVRKAISVRRTNMRLLPDDSFYNNDENFWYDDLAQNSGLLMNEPILVYWESSDSQWLFVRSSFCSGWVKAEDVAYCNDEEFNRYFDYAEKNDREFITITADRFILPAEYAIKCEDKDFKGVPELFMGTYLHCIDWNQEEMAEEFANHFTPRIPYASFVVEIPYRKSDGNLAKAYASIPAGRACQGFLDYTTANVLTLAFKPLGIRYGWGGMENARDCSEYMKDIYRCFGFTFSRNSRSQFILPGKSYPVSKKSTSAKKSIVSSLEPGSILGISGHVFMYLGKVNGHLYTISALGSYYFSNEEGAEEINACSVNVNTLEVYRKNKKNWLENLVAAKEIQEDKSTKSNRIYLDKNWTYADFSKINSGYSILYKANKNRKNITVAINPGHGTKNGSRVKTYSHPDKSPKLTGGTTALGAIESTAISDGMVFNNGKTEADVNLRTAHLLKKNLLKEGYDVLMIRDYSDTQLDNVARTVISNNNADIHVSIHFDLDHEDHDKGVFYGSMPEGLKKFPNVAKHFSQSERLGQCLLDALVNKELPLYKDGRMELDLTQTTYSTIPTVDIELGNQCSENNGESLKIRAEALCQGINSFFGQ